ncbi:hypothetical protein NFI96_007506 [Prochilodus magdalenae]|nr:hypothetical protein NFI96_007506 [Prochilodus magdalenae]
MVASVMEQVEIAVGFQGWVSQLSWWLDVSELSAAEMLAAPQERKRAGSSAAPEEPKALPVGKPSSRSSGGEVDLRDSSKYSVTPACVVLYDVQEVISTGKLQHPHTVPADGAVGVEVEEHQAFWTCDNRPFILVLTTVPPHTDSLGVSTKTKAGLVTEDDPLPF